MADDGGDDWIASEERRVQDELDELQAVLGACYQATGAEAARKAALDEANFRDDDGDDSDGDPSHAADAEREPDEEPASPSCSLGSDFPRTGHAARGKNRPAQASRGKRKRANAGSTEASRAAAEPAPRGKRPRKGDTANGAAATKKSKTGRAPKKRTPATGKRARKRKADAAAQYEESDWEEPFIDLDMIIQAQQIALPPLPERIETALGRLDTLQREVAALIQWVEKRMYENEVVTDMLQAAQDVQKQLKSAGLDANRVWNVRANASGAPEASSALAPRGPAPPPSQFWQAQGRAPRPNADALELAGMFHRLPVVHRAKKWQPRDVDALKQGVLQQVQDAQTQDAVEAFKAKRARAGEDATALAGFRRELLQELQRLKALTLTDDVLAAAGSFSRAQWEQVASLFNVGRSGAECKAHFRTHVSPQTRADNFSELDDQALLESVERHGTQNWRRVAEDLGGGVPPWLVLQQYQALQGRAGKVCVSDWDPADDEALLAAVDAYGLKWSMVAPALQGKYSEKVCRLRLSELQTSTYDGGGQVVGRWTKEETDSLERAVVLYGNQWFKVAAMVKTRNMRQCQAHCMFRASAGSMRDWSDDKVDLMLACIKELRRGPGGGAIDWNAVPEAMLRRGGCVVTAETCMHKYKMLPKELKAKDVDPERQFEPARVNARPKLEETVAWAQQAGMQVVYVPQPPAHEAPYTAYAQPGRLHPKQRAALLPQAGAAPAGPPAAASNGSQPAGVTALFCTVVTRGTARAARLQRKNVLRAKRGQAPLPCFPPQRPVARGAGRAESDPDDDDDDEGGGGRGRKRRNRRAVGVPGRGRPRKAASEGKGRKRGAGRGANEAVEPATQRDPAVQAEGTVLGASEAGDLQTGGGNEAAPQAASRPVRARRPSQRVLQDM